MDCSKQHSTLTPKGRVFALRIIKKGLKLIFGCIRLSIIPSSYIFYQMDPQSEGKQQ